MSAPNILACGKNIYKKIPQSAHEQMPTSSYVWHVNKINMKKMPTPSYIVMLVEIVQLQSIDNITDIIIFF